MKYGDPALPERFWAKVAIGPDGFDSKTGANLGPCLLWTAGLSPNGDGYGWYWNGKRPENAHRSAYVAVVGPVAAGLGLDHLCRVRRCVNDEHLEPVTGRVNSQRGDSGRIEAGRTHCPHGHAYTPENTYVGKQVSGTPHRGCMTCHRERERVRRERSRSSA